MHIHRSSHTSFIAPKFLLAGLILLGGTSLSGIAHATSAASATPPAATLEDPATAATVLDQQNELQGSGETDLKPATDTAVTPAPALKTITDAAKDTIAKTTETSQKGGEQPDVVLKPKTDDTGDAKSVPSIASVLAKTGVEETSAETPPLQPPPGMDLPVDSDLEAAANKTEAEKEAEERQNIFNSAAEGLMPMKTDEIRKILEMYDETQQAVQTPVYPNPTPESSFQTISLQPGTAPIEVKTAMGHVTTLSIVDVTGQPWPIQDVSWAGNFEVLQPETGSNMLRITPSADFAYGNVSMRLIGLNPPVILTLRTERKSVQVRLDLQIPEIGPNGVAPPIQTQISTTAGDGKLATILEGVAPAGSTRMIVNGIDGRTSAYEVGGVTYVRTPYTLLSPAWDSSVRSADGTNVYSMRPTPVLLLSDKGKMVRAQLTKAETSDE